MLRALTPAPSGPCPTGEGFGDLQEGGHENNTGSPLLCILYAGRGAEGFMKEVAQGQQDPSLSFLPSPTTPLGTYFGPSTWTDCPVL